MVAAAAAAAFLVIVGLIVVPYYLLVVKEEQQFLGRLQPKAAAAKVLKGVLKEEERYSAVEPIDAALKRATGFTQPISRFLEQSGMRLTVSAFLLLTVTLPLAAFVVVNVLTSLFVAALLAAVVVAPTMKATEVKTATTARIIVGDMP
jgi:Flp pilus assembly protein TadB